MMKGKIEWLGCDVFCAFSYREANTCCCCMISSKLAGTENKTTITDPTLYPVLRVKRPVVRVLSECCLYSLSFHRLFFAGASLTYSIHIFICLVQTGQCCYFRYTVSSRTKMRMDGCNS